MMIKKNLVMNRGLSMMYDVLSVDDFEICYCRPLNFSTARSVRELPLVFLISCSYTEPASRLRLGRTLEPWDSWLPLDAGLWQLTSQVPDSNTTEYIARFLTWLMFSRASDYHADCHSRDHINVNPGRLGVTIPRLWGGCAVESS